MFEWMSQSTTDLIKPTGNPWKVQIRRKNMYINMISLYIYFIGNYSYVWIHTTNENQSLWSLHDEKGKDCWLVKGEVALSTADMHSRHCNWPTVSSMYSIVLLTEFTSKWLFWWEDSPDPSARKLNVLLFEVL